MFPVEHKTIHKPIRFNYSGLIYGLTWNTTSGLFVSAITDESINMNGTEFIFLPDSIMTS